MAIDHQSKVFIVDDDPIGVEPVRILLERCLGVEAVVYERPKLEDITCRAALPPMIILASHEPSSSLGHAVRAGTVDLLVKPVDPEQLLSSVRKALNDDRRRRRAICARATAGSGRRDGPESA